MPARLIVHFGDISKDMKKIQKIQFSIAVLLSLGFLMLFAGNALAQCDIEVESRVEQQQGSPNFSILLKVENGSGSIEFYLIDLNNPHKGPVQRETRTAAELRNDFVAVFRNVPPSTYTIQAIDSRKCQVSVGGVGGIMVSNN